MRDFIDNSLQLRTTISNETGGWRLAWHAAMLLSVALVLLFADLRGWLQPAHSLVEQLLAPSTTRLTHLHNTMWDAGHGLFAWQQVQQENIALRQQISQLQAELVLREQAVVENARLREQLAIQEQRPWSLIGAEVTVRTPDVARRVMTISRGAADGLTAGMAVVGQTGTGPVALIGVIEAVNHRTASVLLTTDFGNRLSVRVVHQGDSTLALMQGQWQRGSRLRLEQAEQDSLLQEGAIVVSAGLTGKLAFDLPLASVPEGVPIGVIDAATNDGNDRYADVRPYADPDQVRYVWVILSRDE
jgi:rod shape-determining protein MreC